MAEAPKRSSIDVLAETKAEGNRILKEHFPPGTSAWAFYDDALRRIMTEFKAGKTDLLGVTARSNGTLKANGRQETVAAG